MIAVAVAIVILGACIYAGLYAVSNGLANLANARRGR